MTLGVSAATRVSGIDLPPYPPRSTILTVLPFSFRLAASPAKKRTSNFCATQLPYRPLSTPQRQGTYEPLRDSTKQQSSKTAVIPHSRTRCTTQA